jgi:hypothetical protein
MDVLVLVEAKNYQKVSEMLKGDEVVSLASLVFKDAREFGKEGYYYCWVSGLESQCKKALELVKDLAREVTGNEKEAFIKKMEEDENKAIEGFGAILG